METHGTNAPGWDASASALALGTVQLGMRYGIANRTGQPEAAAAATIVHTVWRSGVRFFDTAQSYGTSEEVLGGALAGRAPLEPARVVTKLSPDSNFAAPAAILRSLEGSLRRLQVDQLWGVLLHREDELGRWSDAVAAALREAQRAGLVARVGVSVYSPERAEEALGRDDIEIIQVPANVFDRRLARTDFFARAHRRGKTVFVRSVFLQGLALLAPNEVQPDVPRAVEATAALRQFCAERELDLRQFAVDHVRQMAPEARIILGVETAEQARENCALFLQPPGPVELHQAWSERWPADDPGLIDPRGWPRRN